jgi:hypothetical protein
VRQDTFSDKMFRSNSAIQFISKKPHICQYNNLIGQSYNQKKITNNFLYFFYRKFTNKNFYIKKGFNKVTLKYTNLFVILPATFLTIMLGFSALTVQGFAQSEETNQTMQNAGESANQTGGEIKKNASDVGSDMAEGAKDVGSKVTEGAKDTLGKIGEGLENLGK